MSYKIIEDSNKDDYADYNYLDDILYEYYESMESAPEDEGGFQYCYQWVILGGHCVLIFSYLIACFVYMKTFNKSLRWYLTLKCLVVITLSASSLVADSIVQKSYAKSYYDSGFFVIRVMIAKSFITGKLFVCNLNFLFQYNIYCMVCQSVTFTENLAVKLLAAVFFSFLPAASTFRYVRSDESKNAEEFGLEMGYYTVLFVFMVFFIHKIRKAFVESMVIRSNSSSAHGDQARYKKIFFFLIAMAIIHLMFMTPQCFFYAIKLTAYSVSKTCTVTPDLCFEELERLSCISYAKDILHISVTFLDLFPFFVFMKLDKLKCRR